MRHTGSLQNPDYLRQTVYNKSVNYFCILLCPAIELCLNIIYPTISHRYLLYCVSHITYNRFSFVFTLENFK